MEFDNIFEEIEKFITIESSENLDLAISIKLKESHTTNLSEDPNYGAVECENSQWQFVCQLLQFLVRISNIIERDDSSLLSVKQQKILKSSLQLIVSLGLLPCLLPGVGLPIEKRSEHGGTLNKIDMNDEQKYDHLKTCINFLKKICEIPIFKNMIIANHLSDYLAALMQICFAPLKKPGIYSGYSVTQDRYDELQIDKVKYTQIYNDLVMNNFQPIVMRELLILQTLDKPPTPRFLKKAIGEELSRRLLASGGLLSLIRCFIETSNIDAGMQWNHVEMISKIVSAKHGTLTEPEYLSNICQQLKDIIASNNTFYISIAAACLKTLITQYEGKQEINSLSNYLIDPFRVESYMECNMPGVLLLTASELQQKIDILHACFCATSFCLSSKLLSSANYMVFLINITTSTTHPMKSKLNSLNMKYLCDVDSKAQFEYQLKAILFGLNMNNIPFRMKILVENVDVGVQIKASSDEMIHPFENAADCLLGILKSENNTILIKSVFEFCLNMLCLLTEMRKRRNKDLLEIEDEITDNFIDKVDEQYAVILKMLEDLSESNAIITLLNDNPEIIVTFINFFINSNKSDSDDFEEENDECVLIALVLLNSILSESSKASRVKYLYLLKSLENIASNDNKPHIQLLANEAIGSLSGSKDQNFKTKSKFEMAISDICDNMVPVCAHGLMELSKLIAAGDPETFSKKHYVLCIFQEHLKNEDSYIYLTAINGMVALSNICTQDVLDILCKEFIGYTEEKVIESENAVLKKAEMKMKIGDILVKVTKNLGDMAVVHKTLLLNTILVVCRDNDPLIRASALSNLAEVSRVLSYKLGTIIHEILMCIWHIVDTDKSVECRRAAVMVAASLLQGTDKDSLVQLQDVLLPLYRALKHIYNDDAEDSIVRLHAQLALQELNDIVRAFIKPVMKMEKTIYILDKPNQV